MARKVGCLKDNQEKQDTGVQKPKRSLPLPHNSERFFTRGSQWLPLFFARRSVQREGG